MRWAQTIENIFTLSLACGLAVSFYYYTQSPHSFWWMLLLVNLNYPVTRK